MAMLSLLYSLDEGEKENIDVTCQYKNSLMDKIKNLYLMLLEIF